MTIEEIVALEHDGWTSLCESRGADFYGRIMTDDAVMVLSHGVVLGREAAAASLNDAPPWNEYQISGERLITIDDSTVALVYTGRASRTSDEPAFHALMSSVYTRREGEWRLALYQQTPIPEHQ